MKLTTLAKQLNFTTGTQYFDYCIASWFNGQIEQCRELFKKMTHKDQKAFIEYIKGCYDYTHDVEKFYFDLL